MSTIADCGLPRQPSVLSRYPYAFKAIVARKRSAGKPVAPEFTPSDVRQREEALVKTLNKSQKALLHAQRL